MRYKFLKNRLKVQWDILNNLSVENKILREQIKDMVPKSSAVVIQQGTSFETTISKVKADLKKQGCCLCGYKKCAGALDFHHVETKTRGIAMITNIVDLIDEFDCNKIVLLCAVCHRELHHGYISPDFTGLSIDIHGSLKFESKRIDRRGNKRWKQ